MARNHSLEPLRRTPRIRRHQAKKLQTESQLENPDDLISYIGEVRYCFISALEKINQFKDVFDPLYAQVAELDGSDENDDGSG